MDLPHRPMECATTSHAESNALRKDKPATSDILRFHPQHPASHTTVPDHSSMPRVSPDKPEEKAHPLFNKVHSTAYFIQPTPSDAESRYDHGWLVPQDLLKTTDIQTGKWFLDGTPGATNPTNSDMTQNKFCQTNRFQPVYSYNQRLIIPSKNAKVPEKANLYRNAKRISPRPIKFANCKGGQRAIKTLVFPNTVQQVIKIPDKLFRTVVSVNSRDATTSKSQRAPEEGMFTTASKSLDTSAEILFPMADQPQSSPRDDQCSICNKSGDIEGKITRSSPNNPQNTSEDFSFTKAIKSEETEGVLFGTSIESQAAEIHNALPEISGSQVTVSGYSSRTCQQRGTFKEDERELQGTARGGDCEIINRQQSAAGGDQCITTDESPGSFAGVLFTPFSKEHQGAHGGQSTQTLKTQTTPGEVYSTTTCKPHGASGASQYTTFIEKQATDEEKPWMTSRARKGVFENIACAMVNKTPCNSGDTITFPALILTRCANEQPLLVPFISAVQGNTHKPSESSQPRLPQTLTPVRRTKSGEVLGTQNDGTSACLSLSAGYMSQSQTYINTSNYITKAILPKSSLSNNHAENQSLTVNIGIPKCTIKGEILPERQESTKESLYSGLKILETVSLSDVAHADQSIFLHTNSADGFYRCGCEGGICTFRAQLQADFEHHIREAHHTEKDFVCVHCGSRESSPGHLLYHLDHHLDFQRFSLYCTHPDCNFHSFNPDEVIQHMMVCHPDHNEHVCWCCSQWTGTLQQLQVHIKQNLLYVAICPHCDAKDTDRQRILEHITATHPAKGRMIVFHKLLLCGERKMFGCKVDGPPAEQTSTIASANHALSDKESDTATTAATIYDRSDSDKTNKMAAAGAGQNPDHNPECISAIVERKNSESEEKLTVYGPSHDQKVGKQDENRDVVCHRTSEEGARETQTHPQDPENEIPAERTLSTEDLPQLGTDTNHNQDPDNKIPTGQTISTEDMPQLETDTNYEHMNSTKLIFVRNGAHFECLDTSMRTINETEKLLMEPVDLEISVDELDPDNSVSQEEPVTSNKDTRTNPPSTASSTFSPEKANKDKFYKCTVVSAGRSIKLVSSKSMKNQPVSGAACAENAARKIKKEKEHGSGVSKQTPPSRRECKTYSCRLCPFTSRFSRGIYQHMYSKHSHIVACPQCKARCKTRASLFSHLRKHHPDEAKTIFDKSKLTKWIRITPRSQYQRKTIKLNSHTTTTVLSSLNEQDYPVNDCFVISNRRKERSIHCVLCDYSFKKYHRSNANVYRSMYKHLFLRHIPHEYQCPICHFTDDREDKTRKHMKEMHGHCEDQEPQILVQSQSPIQQKQTAQRSLGSSSSSSGLRQSKRVQKKKMAVLKDYVMDFSP